MKSAMHRPARRLALAPTAAALLSALTAMHADAASVTLCAEPYIVGMPDAAGGQRPVPMWGYRQVAGPANCSALPGLRTSTASPLLTVPPGDSTLSVTLVNRLTVPTSIVVAAQALPVDGGAPVMAEDLVGPTCDPATLAMPARLACRVRSFTGETAPGTERTYTFSNLRPGTYLYQSGTHPQVQVQMGLAGMARVIAAADPGYDREAPVVLSEIDADMHDRIAATLGSADPTTWKSGNHSTFNYSPRYFLVNGRVFAGVDAAGVAATDIPVAAANGARVGLRVANAGLQSRTLMLNNGTLRLLGEDGYPYPAPREQATVLVPAGKTTDAQVIAAVPATGVDRTVALFDRRAGTDNGDGRMMGGQVARLAQTLSTGPLIEPVGPQVANEGSAFSLQMVGSGVTTYSLQSGPAGAAVTPAGLVSWSVPTGTPAPTLESFTVAGSNGTSTVTQSFGVRVNHRPFLTAPAPVAVPTGTVTVAAPGVLTGALDPDADTLRAAVVTGPASGTLSLQPDGSFTWTGPQPVGAASTVTFSVASRDVYGLQSAPVTVSLNVASANATPVAVNDGSYTNATTYTPGATVTLVRGGGGTGNGRLDLTPLAARQLAATTFTANDTDDGAIVASTLALVSFPAGGAPAGRIVSATRIDLTTGADAPLGAALNEATATVSAGTLTFTPRTTIANPSVVPLAQYGLYRIRYTVGDDRGATSNQATAYVLVQ